MNGRVGELREVWTVVEGRRMFARLGDHPLALGLPPVVMAHGLSMSSGYLDPLARRLAPFCAVYAPDLPGFGRSEHPDHALDLAELADALAAWMRAIGLERAVVLGHSLGCQVVARFAERYPEMTLGGILISPTLDPDLGGPTHFLHAALNFLPEPLTMSTMIVPNVLRAGPLRTLRTFLYALGDQSERRYRRLPTPTIVVRGGRDPIVSQHWAERVASLTPEARPLVYLRGHTHAMNTTAPRSLLRVILPFLREVAAREDGQGESGRREAEARAPMASAGRAEVTADMR